MDCSPTSVLMKTFSRAGEISFTHLKPKTDTSSSFGCHLRT
jgi:hypothetical protein